MLHISKSEWLYGSQWELIDATLAVQAARAIPSFIRSEPQGVQCYSIKKRSLIFPNWQDIKTDKNRHSKSTHFKVCTSLYMSLLIAQLAAPMVD